MSSKRNKTSSLLLPISIIALVVLINILYDPGNLEETKDAITFEPFLDLTDDKLVENAIIVYLVNRDNEPDEYKLVEFETIENEYNISIMLGAIRETDETSFENLTISSQTRFFSASIIDYSKPHMETSLSGWIDERKKVNEWDVLTVYGVTSSMPGMWVPETSQISVDKTVEASNRFAFDLYNTLSTENDNILFSPYSISTALSMVYEGARGETAEEMQNVFHFTNTSQRLVENRDLYESLNNQSGCELSTANSLWIQNEYPVLEEYRNKITEFYQAEVNHLDLAGDPEESRLTINTWVENQTSNKIKDLFPPNSFNEDTRLVLSNAVYFKGGWLYQFDPERTQPQTFKVSPDHNVTVDMMSHRSMYVNITERDGVQILELPYVNSTISMVIILPTNKNLANVEQDLSHEQLNSWMSQLEESIVDVYFPRFTFEAKLSMKETLSEMGMPSAFDDADLTGINPDGGLFIDKVFHQAVIEVDEMGTEAAAATGVVVALSGNFGDVFRADHPFLFFIWDRQTGAILFMGRMVDPTR